MQRDDDSEFWQSVTGTMEAGELPQQTAAREVWEETGINVANNPYPLIDCQHINRYVIRQRWQHRYAPNVTKNTEHVFSLKVPADTDINMTEHTAFIWLSPAHAADKAWSETNRQAILDFVKV